MCLPIKAYDCEEKGEEERRNLIVFGACVGGSRKTYSYKEKKETARKDSHYVVVDQAQSSKVNKKIKFGYEVENNFKFSFQCYCWLCVLL